MGIIKIGSRIIGEGNPAYIIAEMSANHNQDFDRAMEIVSAAKDSGADAIKLQTYTPDTITLNCKNDYFMIKGTIWNNQNLYELYETTHTKWGWHAELQKTAHDLGLDFFSTPFDFSSVDFLVQMNIPAYKVASPELVDIPLLKKIASAGKPVIVSTGMGTLGEIDTAVRTIRETGNNQVALLKCTSAYPALPEEMNLKTIEHLSATFEVPAGLSDHTLGIEVPVAAVASGASIIEKHLTLSRDDGGPDSAFSLEPAEFKAMVRAVRIAEKAMGQVRYGATEQESIGKKYRRSLFVSTTMGKGQVFSQDNIKSVRPGHGLPPVFINDIIGRKARTHIEKGTPLSWDLIQ